MHSAQQSAISLPLSRSCPFDPPDEYRDLREERPMTRLTFPDGNLGWLMTRHHDVRSLLADDRFSADRGRASAPVRRLTFRPEDRIGLILSMDPPDHTRYRHMLTRYFTVRRMRELGPRIEQIVAEHLDDMERSGPPVDLVQSFALPIPSLVICELLGVPADDRPYFQAWTSTLLRLDVSDAVARGAQSALRQYMLALVEAKRTAPDDGLISKLIEEGELDDEELSGVGRFLLVAGHETTANMLALGTYTLLNHPDQLKVLRDRPETIDRAIEELLRYLSIVHLGAPRVANEDAEVGGQLVRAGETVIAAIPAANRDPEQFQDPDDLDITREYSQHVAFGHGIHQCLGQQLARVEMQVAFPALFNRFPTLRPAVPAEEIRMRDDMFIYGVHSLPVAWDA